MLPNVKQNKFKEKAQRYSHRITIQFKEERFVDAGMKCSEIVEENFFKMVRGISPLFSLTGLVCTTETEKWLQATESLFYISETVYIESNQMTQKQAAIRDFKKSSSRSTTEVSPLFSPMSLHVLYLHSQAYLTTVRMILSYHQMTKTMIRRLSEIM